MNVLAIADLHLGHAVDKPMDVFGPAWQDHAERIAAAWRDAVGSDDLVLMPGDLSWALKLEEAVPDLELIHSLPGRKFFVQGNHDYWCSQPGKVRRRLPPSLRLLRADAAACGPVAVCGTRGWIRPDAEEFDPDRDLRLWRRGLARLELSIRALNDLPATVRVAIVHFPPCAPGTPNELTRMLAEAGVRLCLYGHLHGDALDGAFEGDLDGVTYRCVSADHVGFRPALVLAL
jgi:predicted phosphohydrolase